MNLLPAQTINFELEIWRRRPDLNRDGGFAGPSPVVFRASDTKGDLGSSRASSVR